MIDRLIEEAFSRDSLSSESRRTPSSPLPPCQAVIHLYIRVRSWDSECRTEMLVHVLITLTIPPSCVLSPYQPASSPKIYRSYGLPQPKTGSCKAAPGPAPGDSGHAADIRALAVRAERELSGSEGCPQRRDHEVRVAIGPGPILLEFQQIINSYQPNSHDVI